MLRISITRCLTSRCFSSCKSAAVLDDILKHKNCFGFHGKYFKNLQKEKIIVEFSSPNIAKKFHVGHFRSTIIGNCISNIMKHAGHDVIKLNYLGDWGLQFALLYTGFKKYGDEGLLKQSAIKHLHDVYVSINKAAQNDPSILAQAQQIFYEMETNKHAESLVFWEYCRDLSLCEFKKLYSQLNIEFDQYLFESMYVQKSQAVVESLKNMVKFELIEDEESKLIVDLSNTSWFLKSKSNFHHAALTRSNGTGLYLTRDLASILDRKDRYDFDKIYYVVDKAQRTHFLQFFGTLEKMGFPDSSFKDGNLNHVSFGRITGMKTREGSAIFLEDILKEAFNRVRQERLKHSTTKDVLNEDHVIQNLALTGLICHDLKSYLANDYKFQWDNALANKGFTGSFLQYTHSRLSNLVANCEVQVPECSTDLDFLEAHELIEKLSKYPDICEQVYTTLEPSFLTNYLFELSKLLSKHLRNLHVKNEKDISLAKSRLLMFYCSKTVLHNGMTLLGSVPLKKM